jgi:hypothetical protein
MDIVNELVRYQTWRHSCVVQVVTNGYGALVQSQLARLPSNIWVENSRKTSPIQPQFAPFNQAPIDDPRFNQADYSNGCAIMWECGMGLTPFGYYPCAIAGGIARITGQHFGRTSLPDDSDDMCELLSASCRLCGRFKDGHYVPKNIRPQLVEQSVSPTWVKLYTDWKFRMKSTQ